MVGPARARLMAEAARKCIEALDAKRQDISMLFLLSKIAWLERFPAGVALVTWLREEVGLRVGEVAPPAFQAEVCREFKARGIRSVAPERFVYATTKQEAKDSCLQAGWPAPFFPMMLQTRPKGAVGFTKNSQREAKKKEETGVFIVFSCWPDALFALITMAATKTFKGYAADFVFENQIADFGPRQMHFPCRIILDCDAKVSEFNNEFTLEELEECIDKVAPWFVKQMVKIGAIKPTDEVTCYQKHKSRPGKASAHLIFSIMGLPVEDIREVLDRIFVAPWKEAMERQKQQEEKEAAAQPKPKKQKLERRKPPEPWQIADRSTMHGRNQFSTLLFKNPDKNETEYPALTRKLILVNGEVKKQFRLSYTRAEFGPENERALDLLNCCCYTSFQPGFVTISPDFMIPKEVSLSCGFHVFICSAVRLELTHTPQTVAGKKRARGRGRQAMCWTKHVRPCLLLLEAILPQSAGLPAGVDGVSDSPGHWQRGVCSQH